MEQNDTLYYSSQSRCRQQFTLIGPSTAKLTAALSMAVLGPAASFKERTCRTREVTLIVQQTEGRDPPC